MATPHISAEKGDFAKTVLMPGDPLRAKFIADTFLKDVRQVTGVRGMLGFTGTYEGRPISVMGSGMGMAIPAKRPPPPIGTTIDRISGHCSKISRPIVPCPAITAGSSKA